MFHQRKAWMSLLLITMLPSFAIVCYSQNNDSHNPTWWDKYQYILNNGPIGDGGTTASVSFGSNIDVSNECGPQSETYITLNTSRPKTLAAGKRPDGSRSPAGVPLHRPDRR